MVRAAGAGYAAAFLAADEGLEVVIVEADERLGGTCLLRGCIPSKALLHVARVIAEAQEMTHDWGVEFEKPKVDIDKVRARKEKVIATLTGGLGGLAKRRNVKVIKAHARFENSTTLVFEGSDASIPKAADLPSTIASSPPAAHLLCLRHSTSAPIE